MVEPPGLFAATMSGDMQRRRWPVAVCFAACLALAVACFVALAGQAGPSRPAELLQEDLLTATQREEMEIALRHKEDMQIKAAEARIKARMAQHHAAATHLPAEKDLHWAATPEGLMKKFQMYAKTERNLAARIKATQNTMDVIDHPALALQHQLQTLGQKAASSLIHAPIEKPAVFVRHVEEHAAALIQPTALERKAEVRERELGQVEVRELAMVRKVQAENSALRREVSKDTAVNSRTQEELWNEEEEVMLLNRALARDASLKKALAAKDKELAQKSQQLDKIESLMRAHAGKATAHELPAHTSKAESPHEKAKREFAAIAAKEKAVDVDMHDISVHKLAKHEFESIATDEKALVDRMRHEAIGKTSGAKHPAGATKKDQAEAHGSVEEEAADKDDASKDLLEATQTRLQHEMHVIEKEEDEALHNIREKMQHIGDGDAGVEDEHGDGEEDGDEDQEASDHNYVRKLIKVADEASPDDSIPMDDHDREASEYKATMQVLAARPMPAKKQKGGTLKQHEPSRHAAAVVERAVHAARKDAVRSTPAASTQVHAAQHARAAQSKEEEARKSTSAAEGRASKVAPSKGALSDDALKTVEDLAREADAPMHAKVVKAGGKKTMHAVAKASALAGGRGKQAASGEQAPGAAGAGTTTRAAKTDGEGAASKEKEAARKAIKAGDTLVAVANKASAAAKGEASAAMTEGARAQAEMVQVMEAKAHGDGRKQAGRKQAARTSKAAAAGVNKGEVAAGKKEHREIDPMAEINMALKVDKLYKKIGDGHAKPAPVAHTNPPATKAVKTQSGNSAAKAVKTKAAKADTDTRLGRKTTKSDEINPLSIIDEAMQKEEKQHQAKLVEEVRKKAQLRREAAAKQERQKQELAKLNAMLDIKSAHSPAPSSAAKQGAASQSHVVAAKHAAAKSSAAGGSKGGKHAKAAHVMAPAPEMDPLAVIDHALVQEHAAAQHSAAKGGGTTVSVAPKKGSLVDLFGSRVAKSVGTLMDKVHQSEGRSTIAHATKTMVPHGVAKKIAQKLNEGEVERLAKMISTGRVAGSSVHNQVDKARMEKEVDSSVQPKAAVGAKQKPKTKLTDGQVEEEKDREAEDDLELLYKKGLLVNPKASPHAAAQPAAARKAAAHLYAPQHTSKDEEAMRDLESLDKTGMFKAQKQGEEGELSEDELSTGKRDEVGRNKMLQLFGHQVSKQYSREKGLFKNPVAMPAQHAELQVAQEGGAAGGSNWFGDWSKGLA